MQAMTASAERLSSAAARIEATMAATATSAAATPCLLPVATADVLAAATVVPATC
jgi:hypothetical protein